MASPENGTDGKGTVPDRPTPAEVILPSVALIICSFILMLVVSCVAQQRWWRRRCCGRPNTPESTNSTTNTNIEAASHFLTPHDMDVIDTYLCFPNQPYFLFHISVPALASLLLCPFALYMYEPLVEFFWPSDMMPLIPQINDVVSCFLMPAGLVYAIAFGFGFQEASTKRNFMAATMSHQMTLLNQIVMLTFVVEELSITRKVEIFRGLKEEMIDWMKIVAGMVNANTTDCLHGNLYMAVDFLHRAMKKSEGNGFTLLPKLNQVTMELDALMSSRGKHSTRSMPVVQWMFLEVLGFFTFFGVLLLRADSYKLELGMQIVTVFTISFFCYVLADLDSPFHGAFSVPLEPLVQFVFHLEQANTEIRKGIPKERRGSRYSAGDIHVKSLNMV